MTRAIQSICLSFAALTLTGVGHAGDVTVHGDWILLGDVAPVHGSAAEKPIAAAPLPGQRLPLVAEFIEMQASAAGFPVDMPDGETIWVTRSATASANVSALPPTVSEPAPQMPDVADGLVPVLNIDVRRGDPITPDMISMEAPDPKRRIQGLIHSPEYLIDTEATRTVRAGQPLTVRDIKAISVIRKGDPVQLVYQSGALRLTVNAKALGDAAEGEPVRVINLQSNRTMDAIAFAPGEARIGTPGL